MERHTQVNQDGRGSSGTREDLGRGFNAVWARVYVMREAGRGADEWGKSCKS